MSLNVTYGNVRLEALAQEGSVIVTGKAWESHEGRGKRSVSFLLTPALALGWILTLGSGPALASCSGSIIHDAVGGNEKAVSIVRQGDRADVLVNNFNQNQHRVWRAVALLQSGNNFLEAGWVLRVDIFGDQHQRPYRTWVNLGIPSEVIIGDVWFTPGTTHEFKVHDQNGDQNWSFAYDGIGMGNEAMSMTWGLPVTEAERGCTDDSLKADFSGLSKINCDNCSWTSYDDVEKYIDTTGGEWKFCGRSKTRYEVKQTC